MKRFAMIDTSSMLERKLFALAASFLLLYSAVQTLAPAVRVHTWKADYLWQHWAGYGVWLVGFLLCIRMLDRQLPEHDPFLLPIIALLSGWGLLTIWRLNANLGMRQTIWLAVGFLIINVAIRFPNLLRLLHRYKYIWLFGGLLLTVLTFFFGSYPGGVGPRLWLGCCGVYFQPSEPLKFLFITYLAGYLTDQLPLHWSLPKLLTPTVIVAGAAAILLIAQRDLGTATLLIVLYTLIIFLASGKKRILGIAFVIVLIAGIASYSVFDVIRLRVNAWLNPWLDPTGESYQIVQALISVASGRLLGSGPGLGSPTLVPVSHSDFIATAIAEETGLIGISGLILIYGLLLLRGLTIAINARTSYHRILAGGLSVYFASQAIFILGGNLRMLPLTGVTLPFVSYGGSSLVTALFSTAILLIISNQRGEKPAVSIQPRPYLQTAGLLLSAFIGLSLLAGWWGIIRSDNLQFRADNLRWTISERYTRRGDLLDRNNQPIAVSIGQSGDFQRRLLYPNLGVTIGYNSPLYGKSGLEASLDGYLTGLQGTPASTRWLNELIYSQLPPGLDARLSLDLGLQNKSDELLSGHPGALVLMNAATGEIFALASHPSIDPNLIDQKYPQWKEDPGAPMLNRATQGFYPPAAALGPFLYVLNSVKLETSPSPAQLTYSIAGNLIPCAQTPDAPLSWESAIRAGCPGATNDLAQQMGSEQVRGLLRNLGFYTTPSIQLPAVEPVPDQPIQDLAATVAINGDLRISPLQMALAASVISNNGTRPGAKLAVAVKTPHQGWIVLPSNLSTPNAIDPALALSSATRLASPEKIYWQTVARAESAEGVVTWFVGGTDTRWRGSPLAISVILEEDNPQLAQSIGETMLEAAMTPAAISSSCCDYVPGE